MTKLVRDPSYQDRIIWGNSKYGRLTVNNLVGYFIEGSRKRTAYEFTCDCGRKVVLRPKDVKAGLITSCGCYRKETTSKTGSGNTLPDCGGFKNNLYQKFLAGANRRRINVEITKDVFLDYTSKSCHYCGSPPSNCFKANYACNFNYNGLDRVDSAKSYSVNNIVTCCKHCNWAKNASTITEFEAWLKRLTSYRNIEKY
jgi:hypothetical protein